MVQFSPHRWISWLSGSHINAQTLNLRCFSPIIFVHKGVQACCLSLLLSLGIVSWLQWSMNLASIICWKVASDAVLCQETTRYPSTRPQEACRSLVQWADPTSFANHTLSVDLSEWYHSPPWSCLGCR